MCVYEKQNLNYKTNLQSWSFKGRTVSNSYSPSHISISTEALLRKAASNSETDASCKGIRGKPPKIIRRGVMERAQYQNCELPMIQRPWLNFDHNWKSSPVRLIRKFNQELRMDIAGNATTLRYCGYFPVNTEYHSTTFLARGGEQDADGRSGNGNGNALNNLNKTQNFDDKITQHQCNMNFTNLAHSAAKVPTLRNRNRNSSETPCLAMLKNQMSLMTKITSETNWMKWNSWRNLSEDKGVTRSKYRENKARAKTIIKREQTSFYALSQTGKDEQGQWKNHNQDRCLLLDNSSTAIFGVFDGHGINGHIASEFVKCEFTRYIENPANYKINNHKAVTPELVYLKLTSKNYSALYSLFNRLNVELCDKKVGMNYSGTTSILVFIIANKLICANVGDSRAILVSQNKRAKNYFVTQWSDDHKPTRKDEEERIVSSGGFIAPSEDEIGVEGATMRVWVRGENYPGWGISRAIGDKVAQTAGVSPVPEIIEKEINEQMLFVIVASDGVWEFLSNEEVMDIVLPFYSTRDAKGAAHELIKRATERWEWEGTARDDISCVIYFLKQLRR